MVFHPAMLEQRQSQEQSRDPRLPELQPRRLFTVVIDGRLHHSLDAVAAHAERTVIS